MGIKTFAFEGTLTHQVEFVGPVFGGVLWQNQPDFKCLFDWSNLFLGPIFLACKVYLDVAFKWKLVPESCSKNVTSILVSISFLSFEFRISKLVHSICFNTSRTLVFYGSKDHSTLSKLAGPPQSAEHAHILSYTLKHNHMAHVVEPST